MPKYNYTYTSSNLSVFDLETRKSIEPYLPIGNKTAQISCPDGVSEIDYWRGIIDGDGSIGFTKRGECFVSLTTASDNIAKQYLKFIELNVGIKKNINRNKRR